MLNVIQRWSLAQGPSSQGLAADSALAGHPLVAGLFRPRASWRPGTRCCVKTRPKVSRQEMRVVELIGICKETPVGPYGMCGQETPPQSMPDKPPVRTDCRTGIPRLQTAARYTETNGLRVGSQAPVRKYL